MQRDGIGRTVDFEKGILYEGEYDEGKREGYGRAIFKNGNIYEGEWKGWYFNGKGKVTLEYNGKT